MSTDEYSQDLPDEMYMHRAPSAASTSYPNIGSSSSCSLPMPGNMDMNMQMQMQHDQQQIQRQKRKYTRRKQPEERKKRGPRTKDLNAPRMPLNGYVRFLNANRERIKQENPDLSFAEVTKKLASEWSSMSAEEKKAYLDEAEKAKEMYLKELAEYQQTDSYQEFVNAKQRAKQQQQPPQPQMMATPQMPSPSPMPMQTGQMYSNNNQSYYESVPPQQMHANQYSQQMYHQHPQHQTSYPYGMNGSGMSTAGNGHNTAYSQQQQQQYYPSSGHSSVTSDYSNQMSGQPSQYHQARYPSAYMNPTNGMSTNFTPSSANSIDLNDQISMQGNSYSGSSSLSATLEKCNASVMDMPIFTEEFLEHNKTREHELRNLRSLTQEYEEENAILSKHVDDLTTATEKLIQDEVKERETNDQLRHTFERLQQTLVDKMQDINLPHMYMMPPSEQYQPPPYDMENQYYRPSMENFDNFMTGLDQYQRAQALSNSGDGCKSEPLQSIQTAISVLDEVTY